MSFDRKKKFSGSPNSINIKIVNNGTFRSNSHTEFSLFSYVVYLCVAFSTVLVHSEMLNLTIMIEREREKEYIRLWVEHKGTIKTNKQIIHIFMSFSWILQNLSGHLGRRQRISGFVVDHISMIESTRCWSCRPKYFDLMRTLRSPISLIRS